MEVEYELYYDGQFLTYEVDSYVRLVLQDVQGAELSVRFPDNAPEILIRCTKGSK